MYCEKCGQQLPDDASYCPNCGAKTGRQLVLALRSRVLTLFIGLNRS